MYIYAEVVAGLVLSFLFFTGFFEMNLNNSYYSFNIYSTGGGINQQVNYETNSNEDGSCTVVVPYDPNLSYHINFE